MRKKLKIKQAMPYKNVPLPIKTNKQVKEYLKAISKGSRFITPDSKGWRITGNSKLFPTWSEAQAVAEQELNNIEGGTVFIFNQAGDIMDINGYARLYNKEIDVGEILDIPEDMVFNPVFIRDTFSPSSQPPVHIKQKRLSDTNWQQYAKHRVQDYVVLSTFALGLSAWFKIPYWINLFAEQTEPSGAVFCVKNGVARGQFIKIVLFDDDLNPQYSKLEDLLRDTLHKKHPKNYIVVVYGNYQGYQLSLNKVQNCVKDNNPHGYRVFLLASIADKDSSLEYPHIMTDITDASRGEVKFDAAKNTNYSQFNAARLLPEILKQRKLALARNS